MAWTNQTKDTSTFTGQAITNLAVWDDSGVFWDDAAIAWDAIKGERYTNQTKDTSSFTNQVKN